MEEGNREVGEVRQRNVHVVRNAHALARGNMAALFLFLALLSSSIDVLRQLDHSSLLKLVAL
jgi:hypothetical protein